MFNFVKRSAYFGLTKINDFLEEVIKALPEPKSENKSSSEVKRENARKLWEKKPENKMNEDLKRRQTSMLASQGKSDHSGSSYHGPGNVDHEKVDSNMAQRNFNNHDSNRLG